MANTMGIKEFEYCHKLTIGQASVIRHVFVTIFKLPQTKFEDGLIMFQ